MTRPQPTGRSGERCEPTQRGAGQSTDQKLILFVSLTLLQCVRVSEVGIILITPECTFYTRNL